MSLKRCTYLYYLLDDKSDMLLRHSSVVRRQSSDQVDHRTTFTNLQNQKVLTHPVNHPLRYLYVTYLHDEPDLRVTFHALISPVELGNIGML